MIFAISTGSTGYPSKPIRIFAVTGFFTAWETFVTISRISSGFLSNADPSPLLTTFGTGQPILISRISNGCSSILFTTSAIRSGSLPKICMETGCSTGSICIREIVFLLWKEIAFALTISVHNRPAPCSLQRIRNGRSVTPAIGARIKGFSISTEPIFHFIFISVSIDQLSLPIISPSSSMVSPRKNTL